MAVESMIFCEELHGLHLSVAKLTACKSIPPLRSWQGVSKRENAWERRLLNGCTEQFPASSLARKNGFPAVGFHIVPLEETEPGMFSLGLILSKNAPITILHR